MLVLEALCCSQLMGRALAWHDRCTCHPVVV